MVWVRRLPSLNGVKAFEAAARTGSFAAAAGELHVTPAAVSRLVRLLEQSVIDLLAAYGITAAGRIEAPGVYVGGAKIAALGLRIRNGCCYHGLALNVDMDLSPFHAIDPCGYSGLAVTQARELGIQDKPEIVGEKLVRSILERLS